MIIDAFSHVLTQPYLAKSREHSLYDHGLGRGISELADIDARIRDMDETGVDMQVATMPSPPLDQLMDDPQLSAEFATVINNGMYDLGNKHPRIIPIGVCAWNNIPSQVKEAERAIKELGLRGILMYTNSGGRTFDDPEFLPFFQLMSELDKPIWIHPTNNPMLAELKYGLASRYGWPFNTTLAMSYIVYGGVLDRYPNLKIVTHHCGAMVPFFENRGGGEAPAGEGTNLKLPLNDYYRKFYVDTAIQGSIGAMHCSYNFYGPEQMMFGTDYPYAKRVVPQTIDSVKALPIPPAQKTQIFEGNIKRLLGM